MEITIDVEPKELYVGESCRVFGRVTERGVPLKDVDVYIYINGELSGSKKTDEKGEYSFEITFNKPGTYEIYTATEKIAVPEWLKWVAVVAGAIAGGYALSKVGEKRGKE